MTRHEAEAVIIKKVAGFWQDRALDMFREMTTGSNAVTTISGLRIARNWPESGSITFTRDADKKRCRLYMTKRAFCAVAK